MSFEYLDSSPAFPLQSRHLLRFDADLPVAKGISEVFMLLFHGGVWVLELNQNILLVFLECNRYKTNLLVKALFGDLTARCL